MPDNIDATARPITGRTLNVSSTTTTAATPRTRRPYEATKTTHTTFCRMRSGAKFLGCTYAVRSKLTVRREDGTRALSTADRSSTNHALVKHERACRFISGGGGGSGGADTLIINGGGGAPADATSTIRDSSNAAAESDNSGLLGQHQRVQNNRDPPRIIISPKRRHSDAGQRDISHGKNRRGVRGRTHTRSRSPPPPLPPSPPLPPRGIPVYNSSLGRMHENDRRTSSSMDLERLEKQQRPSVTMDQLASTSTSTSASTTPSPATLATTVLSPEATSSSSASAAASTTTSTTAFMDVLQFSDDEDEFHMSTAFAAVSATGTAATTQEVHAASNSTRVNHSDDDHTRSSTRQEASSAALPSISGSATLPHHHLTVHEATSILHSINSIRLPLPDLPILVGGAGENATDGALEGHLRRRMEEARRRMEQSYKRSLGAIVKAWTSSNQRKA